jgi:alpha-mannosidase
VNLNASHGGPIRAFYSTPSHYTDAKAAMSKHDQISWEVRSDDIFPLANEAHAYWSGYFTSRPSLKRQVRFASNFLNAARQMEVITGITAAEVDTPTTRPSPPVGSSWTDSMEGAIGVATHHDGMSGTERQDVSNDYSQRISEGHFEVEAGVAMALKKLTGIKGDIGHCNCNAAGNCLNMSMCAYTTGVDEFTVIAWNPLAQNSTSWLRIPVSGDTWTVTDLATKAELPSQATALDARTKSLPLLYLNRANLSAAAISAESARLSNKATHVVTFEAPLPPVGYSTFSVKKSTSTSVPSEAVSVAPTSVSNGVYSLTIDHAKGAISSIKNLKSGVETTLNISWGYYISSEGDGPHSACTKLPNGTHSCSTQASGAYLFRPQEQYTFAVSSVQPTIGVSVGPLVTEVKQSFGSWATHTVRLTKGSPYVEVDWIAGPIPWNQGKAPLDPERPDPESEDGTRGKELVIKFSSGIESKGTFFADSNGREMIKRVRNERGPSYPPLQINEPVAGNYCAPRPPHSTLLGIGFMSALNELL